MKKLALAAVSILVAAIVSLVIMLVETRRDLSSAQRRNDRLDAYCARVVASLLYDANQLTITTDPTQRVKIVERLAGKGAGGAEDEIRLCESRPVDLSGRDECIRRNDYECLSSIAKKAAAAIQLGG